MPAIQVILCLSGEVWFISHGYIRSLKSHSVQRITMQFMMFCYMSTSTALRYEACY